LTRRNLSKVRALLMSGEKISRIKPFDKYDWLKVKDIERCPYAMFTAECGFWSKRDDRRMLLIALDRYADHLQGVDNAN
jgi:hypothetical protein